MAIVIVWLVCGIIAAMIGSRKGEGCASFIIGMLLGPFGILIALFSKGNRRECPYCRELVHKEAIICPHCRKDIPEKDKITFEDVKSFFTKD